MTSRSFCTPAAFVFGTALLASSALSQTRPATPQSPYGGVTVEDIVARVNDQIITQSDYDRAMKELDTEAKQRGATMQQISEAHNDLLRDLIDRQLWLSKGKELGITGDTELIKKLDEIRKQYKMETLEDLEKAAKEQGVSFEDFKANIRNGIITQEVMREQVGRRVQFTQGEVQRYFEEHKQDYAKPESVELSEILVSTGSDPDDAAKTAAGKAKADDIEAKLHAGGDFAQLAKTFSDGTTASDGGAFGNFHKGELAKVFEDATFGLKAGQYTDPIRTREGYIIFKVDQHIPGGVPAFKDVEQDVEQNFYESRMEPAMRGYLTEMREQAYIDIKPGYVDSGASAKEIKPVYSAYAPPTPKKKKKVERTRFRETGRSFRQKSGQAAAPADAAPPAAAAKSKASKRNASLKTEKPGKKEKIRFGKAPTKTLPPAASSTTEDAGAAAPEPATTEEPVNPLEATRPTQKSRYSARAKAGKKAKVKGPSLDSDAPAPPDAAEVADRQAQAAPLGLAGDTGAKKKKNRTTAGDKTRLTYKNKKATAPDANAAPTAPAPQAPPAAPAQSPAPQP